MQLIHITTEGERWDQIAWKYYRRVSPLSLLIEANPHVPVSVRLAAGLRLAIPIIEQEDIEGEDIPEWAQ